MGEVSYEMFDYLVWYVRYDCSGTVSHESVGGV